MTWTVSIIWLLQAKTQAIDIYRARLLCNLLECQNLIRPKIQQKLVLYIPEIGKVLVALQVSFLNNIASNKIQIKNFFKFCATYFINSNIVSINLNALVKLKKNHYYEVHSDGDNLLLT